MGAGNILLQVVLNGIMRGGVYALLGLGLTITYGVVRIVNFSHGEWVMYAMYVTYSVYTLSKINPFGALFIVVPLFFVIGCLIYRLLFVRLIDAGGFTQVFMTNGLAMAMQNAALIVIGAYPVRVNVPELSKVLVFGSIRASLVDVAGFLLSGVLMIILFLFLKYTYTGKGIRAVVDDRQGAKLVGLNVDAMYQLALGIGFACIGAAGAILVTNYYAFPGCGSMYLFVAFIGVVLGGRNSIPGTVLGAMLVGLVESLSGFYIAVHLKEAMYFLMFLLFLLIRPTGMFGSTK